MAFGPLVMDAKRPKLSTTKVLLSESETVDRVTLDAVMTESLHLVMNLYTLDKQTLGFDWMTVDRPAKEID